MTIAATTTFTIYAAVIFLTVSAAVIDARTRHIPNVVPLTLVILWGLWALLRGMLAQQSGLHFEAGLIASASELVITPDIVIVSVSFIEGLMGALVMGGVLFVLTTVYEVFTHKASFGGGDVKLLAALGLFLGVEKGLLCLLVACVVSILFMMARCMSRRIRTYITERKLVYANELTSEEIEETLQPIRCTSKRVAGFLQDTMPFAPFICLGFFVTLLV